MNLNIIWICNCFRKILKLRRIIEHQWKWNQDDWDFWFKVSFSSFNSFEFLLISSWDSSKERMRHSLSVYFIRAAAARRAPDEENTLVAATAAFQERKAARKASSWACDLECVKRRFLTVARIARWTLRSLFRISTYFRIGFSQTHEEVRDC